MNQNIESAEPQRYTFDNGEYVPKMDILYPPETVFFVKDANGEFVPEGNVGLETTTPVLREVTREFMIETATNFLLEQGFQVLPAGAATGSKIEVGILLGKLRSLVASHTTNHAAIDEANSVINQIEAQL